MTSSIIRLGSTARKCAGVVGNPRSVQQQPEINPRLNWDYTFDLATAAAAVAQHKLGGDAEWIGVTAFAAGCAKPMHFRLNVLARMLRKKAQMWGISERGVLGAVLERDGVNYEFFVRAVGAE